MPVRGAVNDVVAMVDDLLARSISRGASDVHLEPSKRGMHIRLRIDGVLHDADDWPSAVAQNAVARLKVLAGLLTYRVDVPQEGSFARSAESLPVGGPADAAQDVDLRVATFPTIHGERAVVRVMQAAGELRPLPDLGFAGGTLDLLRRVVERPNGLLLVTGPAGAGKSTTLYALARHILRKTPGRSVVSLEDPIEQRVDGLTQIQVQPHGELNYVRAMRSLLRQDVEVLLIGEIRDAQTAHIVVEAALTGHLVMTTMHSADPAEAIARLLEMGVAAYQVVSAVTLVASQRLLRRPCHPCDGDSCPRCAGIGYLGRTACSALAPMDGPLRAAVLRHTPAHELREIIGATQPDLVTDARRLIDAGLTTTDEMRRMLGACIDVDPPATLHRGHE